MVSQFSGDFDIKATFYGGGGNNLGPPRGWQRPLSIITERPNWRPTRTDQSSYTNTPWLATAAAAAAACPTGATFLARTSGLDATHTAAYNALICGLVTDGIWTKFDVLYVFATQDSTTALLNLVSTNYTGVKHGAGTFTADRGYAANGAQYIDPIFNAFSSPSPNFVRNSAHISLWETIDHGGPSAPPMGISASPYFADIFPGWTDGNAYYFINGATPIVLPSVGRTGHYVANRSSSVAIQAYRNATSQGTSGASASAAIVDGIISIGAENKPGISITGNSNGPLAMASIGSSLSAGDVTLFYNRLRTYMTAVGVP